MWWRNGVAPWEPKGLFAEGEEEETEAGGGGTAAPDYTALVEAMNRLGETITKQQSAPPPRQEAPTPPPKPEPKAPLQLPDFDQMTNKEMGNWLINEFGGRFGDALIEQVKEAIAPVLSRQEENAQAVLTERYTREISALADKYKDYRDWADEMYAIVEETPGISPERAYKLARSENPEKAKTLDTKYNPPEAKPPARETPYSFTPGGSGSPAGSGGKPPKIPSKDEAFRNAFKAVNQKWNGILSPSDPGR